MPEPPHRPARGGPPLPRAVALAAASRHLSVASCGGGDNPVEVRLKEDTADQTVLGFPAARHQKHHQGREARTRRGRAGTATATYPGQTRGTRPRAVTLVDQDDWRAGVAASALMARPLRAPILLTDGGDLPRAASTALETLKPTGAPPAGGAQVIEVGPARAPGDLRARRISGGDPVKLAAAIDAFATDVAGRPSPNVVIVSADEPGFAMPAASWAAKSGDAVLSPKRVAAEGNAAGDQAPRTPAHLRARAGARHLVLGGALAATPRKREADPGPHTGLPTRSPSRATPMRPSAGACATPATASCSRTSTARGRGRRGSRSGERQVRASAAARQRRRAAPAARELPARHPARLPLRSCARCLQPRLDTRRRVRDQPRRAIPSHRTSPREAPELRRLSSARGLFGTGRSTGQLVEAHNHGVLFDLVLVRSVRPCEPCAARRHGVLPISRDPRIQLGWRLDAVVSGDVTLYTGSISAAPFRWRSRRGGSCSSRQST